MTGCKMDLAQHVQKDGRRLGLFKRHEKKRTRRVQERVRLEQEVEVGIVEGRLRHHRQLLQQGHPVTKHMPANGQHLQIALCLNTFHLSFAMPYATFLDPQMHTALPHSIQH